jgi:hypothetical protein
MTIYSKALRDFWDLKLQVRTQVVKRFTEFYGEIDAVQTFQARSTLTNRTAKA